MPTRRRNKDMLSAEEVDALDWKVRKQLYENRQKDQLYCLSHVVVEAKKYDDELTRQDSLHQARLSKRQDAFVRSIMEAAKAFGPAEFTDWDLDFAEQDVARQYDK